MERNFRANQLSHAYLFIGQKNLGKKDFAKEFSEFIGCKFPDLMIVEPEEQKEIPIAKIREVQNFLLYKSYNGGFKVIIIDEAEKMNQEAQSCLLKTLEEPKGDTLLILVTSKPEMMLSTIFSRCQTMKFFGKPVGSLQKTEEENKILQEFINVIGTDLSEKFKYTKAMDFEKQDLSLTLTILQKYFRNQLLSKIGQNSESVKKLIKDIKLVEEINNKITFTNANQKLALEILLMNI